MVYVALLRGINVGGNNMIKMPELKTCFEVLGLTGVKTYIQSGNVIFRTDPAREAALAKRIEAAIEKTFKISVSVVVVSLTRMRGIIHDAPGWWGTNTDWKHNLIILLEPYAMAEVVKDVGELKVDIEAMEPGDGVLYQSMSLKLFGRTTTGKLASRPIYKRMTIRNFNTSKKLLELMEELKS